MKYSLSPNDIKIEKNIEDRLFKYEVTYIPNNLSVVTDLTMYTSEYMIKEAIEELEWKVYYFELMNNEFNS